MFPSPFVILVTKNTWHNSCSWSSQKWWPHFATLSWKWNSLKKKIERSFASFLHLWNWATLQKQMLRNSNRHWCYDVNNFKSFYISRKIIDGEHTVRCAEGTIKWCEINVSTTVFLNTQLSGRHFMFSWLLQKIFSVHPSDCFKRYFQYIFVPSSWRTWKLLSGVPAWHEQRDEKE